MDTESWLNKNVAGYIELKENERKAIFHFTILWGVFEASKLHKRASSLSIKRLAGHKKTLLFSHSDIFKNTLTYFRSRYYKNEDFTSHYYNLSLRPNDLPVTIKAVLSGTDNSQEHCALTVLMIIYRFRNNLFHGEKLAYGISGQLENLENANCFLIHFLDSEK